MGATSQSPLYFPLGYRPGLDGLRAVAVLPVILLHAGVPGFAWGGVGVDLFFVLSGYLITATLLKEYTERGRISLTGFYRRRALRLLPALATLCAAFAIYGLTLGRGSGETLLYEVLPVAFYFANWTRALDAAGNGFPHYLGHCWSLAIEEQFYMVWPLCLIAILRLSRRPLIVVLVAFALIALWRAGVAFSGASRFRIYNGTDTRVDILLIGAAVALWPAQAAPALSRACALLWLPALAAAAVVTAKFGTSGLGIAYGDFTTVAIAMAVAVRGVSSAGEAFAGLLSNPVAVWIGRRSYGLYLWHFPIMAVALFDFRVAPGSPLMIVLVCGGAFLCAALSYHFVERPFLARRYRQAARSSGTENRPRHVGGGAARLEAVDS